MCFLNCKVKWCGSEKFSCSEMFSIELCAVCNIIIAILILDCNMYLCGVTLWIFLNFIHSLCYTRKIGQKQVKRKKISILIPKKYKAVRFI